MAVEIITGDAREALARLPARSVRCCVTSPPYFGLRDYGVAGQIGLEASPEDFVGELVAVFREVRRVLADDGSLWLNLGDSYSSGGRGAYDQTSSNKGANAAPRPSRPRGGQKPKDLLGIPWRVAFALQADGWYLRQDIIWAKPNSMPESVTDRCTKAHEYIFMLSKSARYFYDQKAIAEPVADSTVARLAQPGLDKQKGSNRVPGKSNEPMKAVAPRFGGAKYGDSDAKEHRTKSGNIYELKGGLRNRRSVWTVPTSPFKEAHFATFPPEIPELCIRAGSRIGDTILDPFGGAGTTGLVADGLGRNAILVEMNPAYAAMARNRIIGAAPLFATVQGG